MVPVLSRERTLVIGATIYYRPSDSWECPLCDTHHRAKPDCAAVVYFLEEWKAKGMVPPKPTQDQIDDLIVRYKKVLDDIHLAGYIVSPVCISVGPPGNCNCKRCLEHRRIFGTLPPSAP